MLDAAAAVGVDGDINPRSELLKNNLVTLGVTYTICLDVVLVSGSENSTMMAPRRCIPLLFAACIHWDTGIGITRVVRGCVYQPGNSNTPCRACHRRSIVHAVGVERSSVGNNRLEQQMPGWLGERLPLNPSVVG